MAIISHLVVGEHPPIGKVAKPGGKSYHFGINWMSKRATDFNASFPRKARGNASRHRMQDRCDNHVLHVVPLSAHCGSKPIDK